MCAVLRPTTIMGYTLTVKAASGAVCRSGFYHSETCAGLGSAQSSEIHFKGLTISPEGQQESSGHHSQTER